MMLRRRASRGSLESPPRNAIGVGKERQQCRRLAAPIGDATRASPSVIWPPCRARVLLDRRSRLDRAHALRPRRCGGSDRRGEAPWARHPHCSVGVGGIFGGEGIVEGWPHAIRDVGLVAVVRPRAASRRHVLGRAARRSGSAGYDRGDDQHQSPAPRSTSTSIRIAATGPSCPRRRHSPASASMPTAHRRSPSPGCRACASATACRSTSGCAASDCREDRRRGRPTTCPPSSTRALPTSGYGASPRPVAPAWTTPSHSASGPDHGDDRAPRRSPGGRRRDRSSRSRGGKAWPRRLHSTRQATWRTVALLAVPPNTGEAAAATRVGNALPAVVLGAGVADPVTMEHAEIGAATVSVRSAALPVHQAAGHPRRG